MQSCQAGRARGGGVRNAGARHQRSTWDQYLEDETQLDADDGGNRAGPVDYCAGRGIGWASNEQHGW